MNYSSQILLSLYIKTKVHIDTTNLKMDVPVAKSPYSEVVVAFN